MADDLVLMPWSFFDKFIIETIQNDLLFLLREREPLRVKSRGADFLLLLLWFIILF